MRTHFPGSIWRLVLLLLAPWWLLMQPAQADVFRPAYLQLKQVSPDSFDVFWKVPALDAGTTLKARPEFPSGAQLTELGGAMFAAGAVVQRWRLQVPGGLEGRPIVFSKLGDSGLDVLVRVERLDGSEQLGRVLPVDPQFVFKASPGALEVVTTYTALGIEHILTGFDHLLFVLALVFIVRDKRSLLVTITAFTVAHSITLALAALGVVRVSGPPVEATIALSIVFVAAEILRLQRGQEGLAARQPWAVAFVFGLLHGLGFASALAEVGLPQNAIPLSLLFFNVGVELGQLMFIAAVLGLAALGRRLSPRLTAAREGVVGAPPHWTQAIPSYAIGATASYWVIERLAAFWR